MSTLAGIGRDALARLVAADIPPGSYVNLGIGMPTRISDYLRPERGVTLHTENGMLGMGPEALGDRIDPDLVNAGKVPVTERPGASYFHHADSFAMMRGGHLDVCVLGAYQVSAGGDLAVFLIEPGRVVVRDLFGIDFAELAARLDVPLADGTTRTSS